MKLLNNHDVLNNIQQTICQGVVDIIQKELPLDIYEVCTLLKMYHIYYRVNFTRGAADCRCDRVNIRTNKTEQTVINLSIG